MGWALFNHERWTYFEHHRKVGALSQKKNKTTSNFLLTESFKHEKKLLNLAPISNACYSLYRRFDQWFTYFIFRFDFYCSSNLSLWMLDALISVKLKPSFLNVFIMFIVHELFKYLIFPNSWCHVLQQMHPCSIGICRKFAVDRVVATVRSGDVRIGAVSA